MINLGRNEAGEMVWIDLGRLVKSRLLVQANSGGGKSWTLRRLLEQTHGHVQQIVIDPEDEFYTLREKYDYVLVRHDGGDAIPDVRSADLLARRLLELGVSAIISLYELQPRDRREFVKRFLNSLVNAPKSLWHPALVVLDEAHEFAPEKGKGGKDPSGGCGEAVIGLMAKGRKRGFCGILATQRISKLDKDAAAEANNKLIGRATIDIDRKRAAEELGFHTKEQVLSLRHLDPEHGEFFVFGPAISDDVVKINVGPVKTTHPEAGAGAVPIAPAKSKIKSMLAQLADLPKEAAEEQASMASLQQRVRQLTLELETAQRSTKTETKTVEKPVLKESDIKRLEKFAEKMQAFFGSLCGQTNTLVGLEISMKKLLDPIVAGIAATRAPAPTRTGPPMPIPPPPPRPGRSIPPQRPSGAAGAEGGNGEVTRPRQRILDALASLEPLGLATVDKSNVAVFADASPTSSAFVNNLGALRGVGLIHYPQQGRVALTDDGRSKAAASMTIGSPEDLHRAWFAKLAAPKVRILEQLIAIYPNSIDKAELAGLSGASPTSSAYVNNLGNLRSLGLIDYPQQGLVAATQLLFPPGL